MMLHACVILLVNLQLIKRDRYAFFFQLGGQRGHSGNELLWLLTVALIWLRDTGGSKEWAWISSEHLRV